MHANTCPAVQPLFFPPPEGWSTAWLEDADLILVLLLPPLHIFKCLNRFHYPQVRTHVRGCNTLLGSAPGAALNCGALLCCFVLSTA